MITYDEVHRIFHLKGTNVSYVMRIHESGHLEHFHYGKRLLDDIKPAMFDDTPPIELGSSTTYTDLEKPVNLNNLLLEMSTYGKGDYREPTIHIETSEGYRSLDFLYATHDIIKQLVFDEIPQADKEETLRITLKEKTFDITLHLHYTLTEEDVLVRNIVLENGQEDTLSLDRMLSATYDFKPREFTLLKLDGAWIRERHTHEIPLSYGVFKLDSKKGVSSSDHNPFFALKTKDASQHQGEVYGFNLIYSGNFEALIETSPHDLVRVSHGINSFDFKWALNKKERFVTPESISTYSSEGLEGMRNNLHRFIERRITKNKDDRPVLINNWEATYFDFNAKKIIKLAKAAKKLGIECICLDDGWFGKRDDDHTSLGDWTAHPKKLKKGVPHLASAIRKLGLKFGIWVEPEMVNEVSNLYNNHPDWALRHPRIKPALGRHQLMLDLSNEHVIHYLFETLSTLFSTAKVDYVKWDMNRNLSDVYSQHLSPKDQGKLAHLYVLGLYKLLSKLKTAFPTILFESCASGGNRFDLGMHYYMPQGWTSDNTDAYERLSIQRGTALAYPLSTISNHVNDDIAHQTLRHVPLETRYNVASFGVLGYELDIRALSPFDRKVIKKQIEHYKKHRTLFQRGQFIDISIDKEHPRWLVVNDTQSQAILGVFQGLVSPNPARETILLKGLDPNKLYRVTARVQYENLRTFGSLIKHALPVKLSAHGIWFTMLANRYLYQTEAFDITCNGATLMYAGLALPHRFTGSGYHPHLRIMPDFGSRQYYIEEVPHAQH